MGDSRRRPGDRERLYAEAAAAFGAALGRLARAYERDADQRRDLLQEIHVALWRSLGRFDGRCSPRTWVFRVAHNTAISKTVRRRGNAPTILAIADSAEWIDPAGSEEEALDRQRALDRLHGLIRELRPLDRQVMLLYLEQLDAASIAEITGLSAANVATRVYRIKHLLTQRFHGKAMDNDAEIAMWTLWQQQEGEELPMPMDRIRAKAERLDAKRRRWSISRRCSSWSS